MFPSLIFFLLLGAEPAIPPPMLQPPPARTSASLLEERSRLLDSLNKSVQELDKSLAEALAEDQALESNLSPAAEVVQRAERYAFIRELQKRISMKAAEVSRINTLLQANRRSFEQLVLEEKQRDAIAAVEKERTELQAKIEEMKKAALLQQEANAAVPLVRKPKVPSDYFIYTTKEPQILRSIAAEKLVYDDESKWQRIYEANKDKISDPEMLVPAGIDLIIPQIKLETAPENP